MLQESACLCLPEPQAGVRGMPGSVHIFEDAEDLGSDPCVFMAGALLTEPPPQARQYFNVNFQYFNFPVLILWQRQYKAAESHSSRLKRP